MSVLEQIVECKKQELARDSAYYRSIKEQFFRERPGQPGLFKRALLEPGISIIAEFKRRSPSAGNISAGTDAAEQVIMYEKGGARAVSVLTDREFFGGSIDDLEAACARTSLPVLRKDFILEEAQIYEAACSGAAAVLLIAGILEKQQLKDLAACAAYAGLDSLIEVRNAQEIETAVESGAGIIGVNSRCLSTFNVDLSVSRAMAGMIPDPVVRVSESGMSSAAHIENMAAWGFDAVLIGTALMQSADPAAEIQALLGGIL